MRPEGNSAKRVVLDSADYPPPWVAWRERSRCRRCVRFIETYCRPAKGHGAGHLLRLGKFQTDWLRAVLAPGVRQAALSIPRGNGKSSLAAALAVWALFDPDPTSGAPQVPVVATTLAQGGRAVYAVALSMIEAEPELRDRCLVFSGIGTQRVRVPATGGELFLVSADIAGLQGLDPSLAVCDEIGFMAPESWNALVLSSGKRPRSLVVGIGTPGPDPAKALGALRAMTLEDGVPPGFVYREFAADDGCNVHDETQWRQANPAIDAGFLSIDAMRSAVATTIESEFRLYRLGQRIDGLESWLGDNGGDVWRHLRDPWPMVDGGPTWCGLDVGLVRDSTAVVWCQRRPDGRLHVAAKIWSPARGGRLDLEDIVSFLRTLALTYDVREVRFDPRLFELPAQQLEDEGLAMVAFPQSPERMIPAIAACYDAIRRGDLSHNGDELFTKQVLAATPKLSTSVGFTLRKPRPGVHIDAAIALVLAVHAAARPDPTVPARRLPLIAFG